MTLTFTPDLAEFRELAMRGNLIPVHTELIADAESPVSAFQKIDDGGYSFLFESVEKNEQVGRYSFIGTQPRVVIQSRGKTIRITENGASREFETESDPLAELEKLMGRYQLVSSPAIAETRFVGGAVGYLGYDMVRFFEPTVAPAPPDDLELPESLFLITETQLIFDHLSAPLASGRQRSRGGWRRGRRLRARCFPDRSARGQALQTHKSPTVADSSSSGSRSSKREHDSR